MYFSPQLKPLFRKAGFQTAAQMQSYREFIVGGHYRDMALGLCLAAPATARSRDWDFQAAISVTGEPVTGVLHHLDGAGRKHIAVGAESVAVAWDDYRRGDSDIWISNYTGDVEWSADFAPPPASGPGEQHSAALAIDTDGALHLLRLERATADAPGQLRYSRGV